LSEAREHLQLGTLLALHVQRDEASADARLMADFVRPLERWLKLAPRATQSAAQSAAQPAAAPPAAAQPAAAPRAAGPSDTVPRTTVPQEAKPPSWRVRLFIDDVRALTELQSRLQPCEVPEGDAGADVLLVLLEGDRESTLRLPRRYRLEARHMQALKTIAGLAHIAAEE